MAKIKKIIIVLSLITIIIIMGIDIFFLSKFGAIKTFGTRYSSWIKSVAFSPDGTKMYEIGSGSDRIYETTLNTAWDTDGAFSLMR